MSTRRVNAGALLAILALVASTSFLLGYLGMPAGLRIIATLGIALLGVGTLRAFEWAANHPRPPRRGSGTKQGIHRHAGLT